MRRQRKSKNKYSQVQERIKELRKSPLGELALELKHLTDVEHEQNVEYASELLERLPRKFDRDFYFDAWMVQSIMDRWNNDLIPNFGRVVPTRHHTWGYEQIIIPTVTAVCLIYIPPEENIEIPSLLNYPWICHELGHHLLSLPKHQQMLFDKFHSHLEKLVSKLKRMSISDRGLARIKSQAIINEIDAKWRDSKWVEELAIDVIALWTCGPAYLAAFEDEHEDTGNPFVIEPNHPPVELRTYALLQAARELDWSEYLEGLEQIQSSWYRKIPSSIGNIYRSLRNHEFVTECVAAALTYCESVRIPRLKLDDLNKIHLNLDRENDFSNGIELIVAAWLSYQENEECYDNWEEQTLNKLIDEVVQESVKR